jgi:hypothetical protein
MIPRFRKSERKSMNALGGRGMWARVGGTEGDGWMAEESDGSGNRSWSKVKEVGALVD